MTFDIGIGRNSHNLVFDQKGDVLLINGPERVAQDLKIALLTFLGEYFLAPNVGVDYLGSILVKNPDRILIESILRAVASEVRDVLQVLELTLLIDHEARKLGVATVVQTPYGPVEFEAYLNDLRNNT
jgi:hypothetical protein